MKNISSKQFIKPLFFFIKSWGVSWLPSFVFVYLGMEKIIITKEEIELLNALSQNGIKFQLEIDDSDVDIMPIFRIGDINLCYDFNYLIFSDEIDELRFHNINDLISYLKNN
jgi:hypothetical protein